MLCFDRCYAAYRRFLGAGRRAIVVRALIVEGNQQSGRKAQVSMRLRGR